MTKAKHLCMGILVGAASLACSSEESAKIGDPVSVDKNALAGYVGSWEGYVEAFTFISGSDHLRLNLDAEGKGWLQVGDRADLLAPPTDPNVAWPPLYAGRTDIDFFNPNPDRLLDGFRYPIVAAKVEAERIRFSIDPYRAFAAWCAIQIPEQVDGSSPPIYRCIGRGVRSNEERSACVTGDPSVNLTPIDCGKAMLCNGPLCECDANACKAGTSWHPVTFDATLTDEEGSKLDGSILVPGEAELSPTHNGGPFTIHLKR